MTPDNYFPPVDNGARYYTLDEDIMYYGIPYLPKEKRDGFFLLTGPASYQKIKRIGGGRTLMTLEVTTVEIATTKKQIEELKKAIALRDLTVTNKAADIAKNKSV
jgi:hypothetical protein